MSIRFLAFAGLFCSSLACGSDAPPTELSATPRSVDGATIYPIKVSDARKSLGGSLKPDSRPSEEIDVRVELRTRIDENGQRHYECDLGDATSGLTLRASQNAGEDSE